MGFIAGCGLLALLIKMCWDFATKPDERGKMLTGYAAKPLASSYAAVQVTFFLMFFVGIFIRPFGDILLSNDGWQVWEVGIVGTFAMWMVTWFVDIEKLDRKP
jgi:hypothetical protein